MPRPEGHPLEQQSCAGISLFIDSEPEADTQALEGLPLTARRAALRWDARDGRSLSVHEFLTVGTANQTQLRHAVKGAVYLKKVYYLQFSWFHGAFILAPLFHRVIPPFNVTFYFYPDSSFISLIEVFIFSPGYLKSLNKSPDPKVVFR